MNRTCPVTVWEPPGYWHTHSCNRGGKYEIADGVFVCGTHRNEFERRGRLNVNDTIGVIRKTEDQP